MEIPQEVAKVIEQVKSSGLPVLAVTITDREFIYRGISRSEWRHFQKEVASKRRPQTSPVDEPQIGAREEGEDELVAKALISPKVSVTELSAFPAGVVTQLSDLILKASGFVTIDEAQPRKL